MILTKEVEIHVNGKEIKWYEERGYIIPKKEASPSTRIKYKKDYVYDLSKSIVVDVNDLPKGSGVLIEAQCDICKTKVTLPYIDYLKNVSHGGYYACENCKYIKRQDCVKQKYGVDSVLSIPEIFEKTKISLFNNYGVTNPTYSEEIRSKQQETLKRNHNVDNPMKSEVIKNKARITNNLKYGCDIPSQNFKIRAKMSMTMYKNQSVATSSQQLYIHSLYGGELNGVVEHYNVDIKFKNMIFEYSGGGHNLCVKLGNITQEEFDQKELVRNNVIKRAGYKRMEIVSRKDKLPSDEILLHILDLSKQFFAENPERSWITWDIDNFCYYNAYHKETDGGVPFDFGPLRTIKKSDLKNTTNENCNSSDI